MGHSRNTQKESVRAAKRIRRGEDGDVCLPRIIVRRPRDGDIHPLPKSVLARALERIPVEYIYGLTRVELRARQGNRIGDPYGAYWPDEKVIVLYSLPMLWVVDVMSEGAQKDIEEFGAKVWQRGRQWHVRWRSERHLALWFLKEVVVHELGHHFANQYKSKRGRIRGVRFEEMNAELHSLRWMREVFNRIRRRRQAQQAEGHCR